MPFVKKPITPPAGGTIPVKDLKQCQQEARKARQRVESVAGQLQSARESFTRLHEDCVKDETQSIMEIGTILARARETVAVLESTLTIAQRQEQEADVALSLAAKEAQREALRTQLVRLGSVGQRIDDALTHLTQVVGELAPELNDTRALGFDTINQQLTSSALLFKIKLLESCKAMPNCAQAEAWFIKPGLWSASLPTPDDADRAK